MQKFKIGQKVRIVSERPRDRGNVSFTAPMEKWLGKVVTIMEMDVHQNYLCYLIDRDDGWCFHEEWLSPVDEIVEVRGDAATLFQEISSKEGMVTRQKDRSVMLHPLIDEIIANEVEKISFATPILPTNSRFYRSRGRKEVVVVEEPPQVRTILVDKPEDGHGRYYNLAFPYIVYMFYLIDGYIPEYTNRIFFRAKPLSSLDDPLKLCNLTHAIGTEGSYGVGIACMKATVSREWPLEKKIAANLHYYWTTMFQGFQNERNVFFRGFSLNMMRDKRISSLNDWERESNEDPLFVLDVPWLATQCTVRFIIEKILGEDAEAASQSKKKVSCAADLASLMYRIREVE